MRALLLAATALALLCGSAYAERSNSGSSSRTTVNTPSGSQSSSTSQSRSTASSRSSSRSAAVGNVTNVYTGYSGSGSTGTAGTGATGTGTTGSGTASTGTIGTGTTGTGTTGTNTTGTNTTGTGTASSAGDPTVNMNYSGSYTVRNTPGVTPPSVVGGNPCAVGASGGISAPGFGLAMGATWADRACERRQEAALMFNMGEQKVALELMCQDDHIRAAMKIAARPCTADIAPLAPVAEALSATTPVPSKSVAIASAMPVAPKPDWCERAKPETEASKAYVAQLCGK
jgi:hypothetical protein